MPLRDLALTALVAWMVFMAFKQPVFGAYLWTWLSLMNPHKLTYGFAFAFPFAQVAAGLTLALLVFTKQRRALPVSAILVLQILLLVWMTVTTPFALAGSEVAFARWMFVMKIQIMLLVTWMLVTDARQLRWLLWIVVLSVGFFGIKGGVWTVLTGGGGRVWGPPGGMMEGNNELAVALVMLLPLMYFLRHTTPHRAVRHFLLFAMVTCSLSILGSQSRGALLAMVGMVFFLGLKGRHPVRTSLLLLVCVSLAIAFMPDTWSDRMETIKTYQADGSAMSRIWTWTTLWNAAVDRPLIGAGFQADNLTVFELYAPKGGQWAGFAGHVYVAHSIYFQMLGEHGFPGLALFLLLGIFTWITARRIARQSQAIAEYRDWMPLLMRMVQVSLVGYAVGGAFLSLAYLDLPYYVMGFVLLCEGLLRRHAASPAAGTAGSAATDSIAPGARRGSPALPAQR